MSTVFVSGINSSSEKEVISAIKETFLKATDNLS
jgi:hypothetical protein